jgi:hypothetical protein
MEVNDFKEKRETIRRKVLLDIRFLDKERDIQGNGFSCDISPKGIGLFTRQYLAPHSSIEIWIENPSQKSLHLKGNVVWSKAIDFSIYRIGIELEASDLKTLNEFLETT